MSENAGGQQESGAAQPANQPALHRQGAFRPAGETARRRPPQRSRERVAARASESEELLHGTFLIGRDGRVHWVSYGDVPFRNNKALLYELARLENKLPQSESMANAARKQ